MADQTPDPTALDDDQLDNLLDALAERASERDDLDLLGSGASRRTVLAGLLGAGGLGIGATQLGAAASWGSASGTVGTQSSPIDQANVRDLDAKVLETEQVTVGTNPSATITNVVTGTSTLGANSNGRLAFLGLSNNQVTDLSAVARSNVDVEISESPTDVGVYPNGQEDVEWVNNVASDVTVDYVIKIWEI